MSEFRKDEHKQKKKENSLASIGLSPSLLLSLSTLAGLKQQVSNYFIEELKRIYHLLNE